MENLMGFVVLAVVLYIIFSPPNKNSTSYRLGKGLGKKTRKLGEWIMNDED